MANEISVSATLNANKGGATLACSHTARLTLSGNDMVKQTLLVTTTAAAITFGAITGAPSKLLIKNLDSTNYVEVDSASGMTEFPQKVTAGTCRSRPLG